MDNRFFISYSSKDAKIAQKIVSFLENNGHLCWIAPRNIEPGHDYTDSINSAIKNCAGVVLVFSEQALASQFVKKELGLAVHFNKNIIPYKIADFEVDDGYFFLLNNVQWINAAGKVEAKFPELLSGIEAVAGKKSDTVVDVTNVQKTKAKNLWLLAIVPVAIIVVLFLILKGREDATEETVIDTVAVTVQDTVLPSDSTAAPTTTSEETPSADKKKKDEPKVKSQQPALSRELDERKTNNPKPTVQSQQPQDEEEEADEEPVQRGPSQYDLKLRNAKVLYSSGKYREALFLFQELKKENPNGASLDYYISECRKMLDK